MFPRFLTAVSQVKVKVKTIRNYNIFRQLYLNLMNNFVYSQVKKEDLEDQGQTGVSGPTTFTFKLYLLQLLSLLLY